MTAILGISAFYHDSAAALVVDGEIVAAAQEERFTRKKHDHEFPKQAIQYCLEFAGVTADKLDFVGFYDKPVTKFERLIETYLAFAPAGYRSFRQALPLWLKQKLHVLRSESAAFSSKHMLFPHIHHKRMRTTLLLLTCLAIPPALAEPSRTVSYLMGEPVSLFDQGLRRLGERVQGTLLKGDFPEVVGNLDSNRDPSAVYDWKSNRITLYGSVQRDQKTANPTTLMALCVRVVEPSMLLLANVSTLASKQNVLLVRMTDGSGAAMTAR